MTQEFVLGIDGGGSKTLAALANRQGRIVAIARGAGTNPLDNPNWRQELGSTIAALGADNTSLAAVTAGLPAYGEVSSLSRAQEAAVAELFGAAPSAILNDVDAAQYGAFAGGPGILILSGSGSMAWARDAENGSWRVGGWGEIIGDEGSAHWIGMRAIGLVSQSLDGRAEAPRLTAALFEHLQLDPSAPQDSLTGWISGLSHPRSAIASLAELVAAVAMEGDAPAGDILDAAAVELARLATAIEKQLPDGAQLPWSYAGSTLRSPILYSALVGEIGRAPVPPRLPPIGGALLHAAHQAGWAPDPAWIDRLAAGIAADSSFSPKTKQTTSTTQGEQGYAWEVTTVDNRTHEPRGSRTGTG